MPIAHEPRSSPENRLDVTGSQTVLQGEFASSSDPECCLNTVLGSCVSVCMYDPGNRIGGMNHFLLPEGNASSVDEMIFGLHSMELLINGLLRSGAIRSNLQAKLFGGASMISGLSNIGERNVAFAHRFLNDEGFPIAGEDTGGRRGRRLRFWPASGRVQMRYMQVAEAAQIQEARASKPSTDVELF